MSTPPRRTSSSFTVVTVNPNLYTWRVRSTVSPSSFEALQPHLITTEKANSDKTKKKMVAMSSSTAAIAAAAAAAIYVSCTTTASTMFVGVEGFSTTPAIAIGSNIAKATMTTTSTTKSLRAHHHQAVDKGDGGDEESFDSGVNRREILRTIAASAVSGFVVQTSFPQTSWAGIDVSGIRVEGSGGGLSGKPSSNAALQQQLRAYDGSGAARIQQIKQEIKPSSGSLTTPTPGATPAAIEKDALPFAATYAYRSNPGIQPQLKKAGIAGERYIYQDSLVLVSKPSSSSQSQSRGGYVNVQFEFPSDWLQLDRSLGGIQFVDQRNGDKLIVLKAPLPDGESLISVPKQWFAQTVFDPKGTIVASTGIDVDEFKTSRSTILNDGVSTASSPHRRLLLKYATVTPNGLRTERRGLIDAYEINDVAYMMFTGSNAVKFEQNGPERETVERIVNSFVVEAIR